ncbi:MAG: hypothetical protein AMXMBFR66_26070 [Pseudomonadota bacterium]
MVVRTKCVDAGPCTAQGGYSPMTSAASVAKAMAVGPPRYANRPVQASGATSARDRLSGLDHGIDAPCGRGRGLAKAPGTG